LNLFKIRLDITYMVKYDAWDTAIDLNDLLKSYIRIEQRQRDEPVTLDLPPPPEKPPVVEGSHPQQQRFFDPPLQHQRNVQAYYLLSRNGCEKLAILGCGELSFEKYALRDLADRGIRHIVSVDVDEKPLSSGLHYLGRYLDDQEHYTVKRTSEPIHVEVYKGDLLAPSPVLSNIDVAISTEVIEHMPLEKATELLKCVLDKIHPKLYILSTPNFEFNVVFNKQSSFRHDDHHFEFTRKQFKEWLSENVCTPYKYEVYYVGRLDGHEHLDGATQFAKIWREDGIASPAITENEGTYQKVGDFVYRTSYFRLVEAVVVGAFKKFIEAFPFDPAHQTSVGTLHFWRISIAKIMEFATNPTIEIDESDAMMMLTSLFNLTCYKSVDPETGNPAITLPNGTSKQAVLGAIARMFSDDSDGVPKRLD
ncbi:hypothetical protein PMAYCL1PPCAC_20342, partial [Pristionchus mayeri]